MAPLNRGVYDREERTAGGHMTKVFTVSDGKLVLTLEADKTGGYVVSSPLDPELLTQAETIEEAFQNAYDASKALKKSRAKLFRKLAKVAS
jgi:predicted RNase H-like HicB family nuclease